MKILEESQEAGEAKKPRSEEAEKHSKSLEAENKKQQPKKTNTLFKTTSSDWVSQNPMNAQGCLCFTAPNSELQRLDSAWTCGLNSSTLASH